MRPACSSSAVATVAVFGRQWLAPRPRRPPRCRRRRWPRPRPLPHPPASLAASLVVFAANSAARLARLTEPSPTARRSSMTRYPGVANLDPAFLATLRQAATDAALDGVRFLVDSGWRSPEYQEQLLQQAVLKYGSEAEAARWVATPGTSAHVSGEAVDIGRSDAAAWLSEHGAAVRAVPDLPQRTVALRTSSRSRRSRLPSHVRRPYSRPEDAAISTTQPVRLHFTPAEPGGHPAALVSCVGGSCLHRQVDERCSADVDEASWIVPPTNGPRGLARVVVGDGLGAFLADVEPLAGDRELAGLRLDPRLPAFSSRMCRVSVPSAGIASPSFSNEAETTTWPGGSGSVDSMICSARRRSCRRT